MSEQPDIDERTARLAAIRAEIDQVKAASRELRSELSERWPEHITPPPPRQDEDEFDASGGVVTDSPMPLWRQLRNCALGIPLYAQMVLAEVARNASVYNGDTGKALQFERDRRQLDRRLSERLSR